MKTTLKYYILELGHLHAENTLHVFNSLKEREDKTRELILGASNDSPGLDKYLEELTDSGSVEFEGDPGIQWFTAWPAQSAQPEGSK